MISLWLLLITAVTAGAGESTIRQEVKAMAGGAVTLRCAVNQGVCGDFHSIKWYKENRRVFVYSPVVEFSKAEGELLNRGSLIVDSREARLSISPIETTDEGEYKCEITFLDISKNCPVVQLVKLTTLSQPRYVNLSLSTGAGTRTLLANSVVGPFNQGTELTLICESGGGKPIPQVTWYMEGKPVSGRTSSSEDSDRRGTGRSEISLTVDRKQLGAKLECRSKNEALESPLVASVQLDISLRPETVKISGGEVTLRQGGEVRLTCLAAGSRPAAVLTWFNGSSLYPHQPAGQVNLQDDGTYTTSSTLVFPASRFEDNQKMFCEAKNEVIEYYEEEALRADTRLVVLYPPVVYTSPTNLTVNSSQQASIRCSYKSNPAKLTQVKWFLNGEVLNTRERGRFIGGTVDQPSLTIVRSSKQDRGAYSCILENEMGSGSSQGSTTLDVYHPPTVRIRMQPDSPIREPDQSSVSLHCDVVDGNPRKLTSVLWYKDNILVKQLPQCQESSELCGVDPSILLLEKVSRQSHGNFSCRGLTEAGESEMSDPVPLIVYYPPGNATIAKDSDTIIKGGRLTLTCEVPEPGRPAATEYIWRRGGHELRGVSSSSWLVDPVTLETQSEISCQAVNEVGAGRLDSQTLQVHAQPAFIESLKPYTGFTSESTNVSLSCQVECSPLCQISWFKDGAPIETSSDYYTITTRQVPPNYSKNDFESVLSLLSWNLENLPGGRLNRQTDNANYSCRSTETDAGPGVYSATHFRVEYAPDNLFISKEKIDVLENEIPDRVVCGAQAYPEASYMWRFKDQVIQTHNVLFFGTPAARDQGGIYTCEAANRHGTGYVTTHINVMYKPECEIEQEKLDDEVVLTCRADANPSQVSFTWRRGNETYDGEIENRAHESTLRIPILQENLGTYYCFVNNTVGLGVPCEIDIQGIGVLKNISDTNIIVIVAVITAALVAAIIIGILVFFCRKKPSGEKCSDPVIDGKDTELPGSGPSQPVHKWPLRPGVHVHVNGLNTLTGSTAKLNQQINGFSYGAKTSRSSSSSGSDWASNASSNQELNSDSDPKKQQNRGNISGGKMTVPHGDLNTPSNYTNDLGCTGSRPGSRQKKKRDKNNSNNNHSDQLLPTFYENVSSSFQHKQRLDSIRRSESPADRLGRIDAGLTRPRSQQSNQGLYGFGSTRSSKGSRHSASPCGIHSAPGSSIASMCTSGRGGNPSHLNPGRYSTLHAPGYSKPQDLLEAEVESDSELPPNLPLERNLLIEYTTHVPYHQYPRDTPILSSLTPQSLTKPRGFDPENNSIYSGPLLSEPISPPRQFDSSPNPSKQGREGGF